MDVTPRIDHIVHCVRDLDAARARFSAMGFTLTPPARHPFGTGNSLAQMGSSFIELLTVADPERIPPHEGRRFSFGAHNAEFLSRREGMSMLVLSSEDARADAARWRRRGLDTFEPVYFEREATLPDGSEGRVAFTLAFAKSGALPGIVFFCCQQHAPEVFWQPRYQRHANGAVDIASVTLVAGKPRDQQAFFAALVGEARIRPVEDGLVADTAGGVIEVVSPQALPPRLRRVDGVETGEDVRFAAAAVRVARLDAVRARLIDADIPHVAAENRLIVPPDACFGLALEFVGAGKRQTGRPMPPADAAIQL